MDIGKLMKEAGIDDPWKPAGTGEEMVRVLNEALPNFEAKPVFNVGDLVTPRREAGIKGRGKPFKIMQILPETEWRTLSEGNRAYPVNCIVGLTLLDEAAYFAGHTSFYETFDANKGIKAPA